MEGHNYVLGLSMSIVRSYLFWKKSEKFDAIFKHIKARNKAFSKIQCSKILKLSFNKSHQVNPLWKKWFIIFSKSLKYDWIWRTKVCSSNSSASRVLAQYFHITTWKKVFENTSGDVSLYMKMRGVNVEYGRLL